MTTTRGRGVSATMTMGGRESAGAMGGSPVVHTTVSSPLGDLLLVGVERPDLPTGFALASLSWLVGQPKAVRPQAMWRAAREPFAPVTAQLEEYFAGRRRTFDLPVWSSGSAFQERVWQALETIPFGTTTTYGALAARIGTGRTDARAIGTAVGANPLLLIRPCHRVIGADGNLRGFAAGLDRKDYLLRHEGALGTFLDLPPLARASTSATASVS
ncbi:methylated-DNA--[protein]-cysteine S-methyltransferase [Frankia sp. AgPm24]|uniref:methylated-DNA--[protein]-cysteine S-methyltransferase n=1 Tax=Frankia sp. AgPm24 TaxID=631128 RepID=UPI002010627C|nr:methylated-DNA--[protein]-cysteine S-methyltransferase [Frankia sp. AgPm24]MCK9923168.1 methylated-DNA--[protein]-cysteine S-methyltransferase [Frankia sp. AgPm24]